VAQLLPLNLRVPHSSRFREGCGFLLSCARPAVASAKLSTGLAMKISLSPDLERLIAEKVSSGRYRSADEVVREGLELLQERENETRRPPSNSKPNLAAAFESIASDVTDKEWETIPADLSKNLDHHLYGGRKTS
jgi:putative addiction module CopG family antidote